jgi:two-component system chemotaxis sensor kinase CheA
VADGNGQFQINQPATVHQIFPDTYPPANQAWETGRTSDTRLFQSGDSKWFQINVPLKVNEEVVAVLMLNKFATPIAVAISQRQKEVLAGILLALGGGMFVWWFLTSRSLRPLIRLNRASREIAQGNLDMEIPAYHSRSEIGELNHSFRTMVERLRENRAEIEAHNRDLEARIAARTREMQSLLDNMDEGLFTMDGQGAIQPRYSAATEPMLGKRPEEANFIDLLHVDPEVRKNVRDTFALLLEGMIQLEWNDMVANLPTEFQPDPGRFMRARYRPVYQEDGAKIEQVMVILQDITAEKSLREDIDRNRLLHNLVVQIIQNRETFDLFYEDSQHLLAEGAASIRGMDLVRRKGVDEVFRTLHTLKGTAGVFGMVEVAEKAHLVEDVLRDLNGRRDQVFPEEERDRLVADIERLGDMLLEVRRTFLELIGEEEHEPSFTLTESKIDGITAEVLEQVPQERAPAIRPLLARLKRVSTGRLLRKYRSLVESVGTRLGKDVQFTLEDRQSTEMPLDFFKRLDPTFLHIVRNSLDHGIEPPGERIDAGKDALASLSLASEYRDGGIVFTIADDGRGIDTQRIREIALERGFVKPERAEGMTRKEVLRLLFLPSFSSKASVSELSGRGVGLDVVRTEVERMGGRLRLVTRKGRGTTFQLYFPLPA